MHIPKRTAALLQALLVTASFLIGIHFPVYALLPDTVIQTLSAELYTDETFSEPLLNDTEILLTGEMPENAVVRSYPVPYSAEGMKTLAAYDITVFYGDGETVFVKADEVPHPAAVRYSFRNWMGANLQTSLGMPVPPFRSDDWDY